MWWVGGLRGWGGWAGWAGRGGWRGTKLPRFIENKPFSKINRHFPIIYFRIVTAWLRIEVSHRFTSHYRNSDNQCPLCRLDISRSTCSVRPNPVQGKRGSGHIGCSPSTPHLLRPNKLSYCKPTLPLCGYLGPGIYADREYTGGTTNVLFRKEISPYYIMDIRYRNRRWSGVDAYCPFGDAGFRLPDNRCIYNDKPAHHNDCCIYPVEELFLAI